MCIIYTNKNLVLCPNIYAEAPVHCLLSYGLSNFKHSISLFITNTRKMMEMNSMFIFTTEIGSCFFRLYLLVGGRMCMHTFHLDSYAVKGFKIPKRISKVFFYKL